MSKTTEELARECAEPVAWARYPRYTGSAQKPLIVFTRPQELGWVELFAFPPAPQPCPECENLRNERDCAQNRCIEGSNELAQQVARIKELEAAAQRVLRDALDKVDVHPCDIHNDSIRAEGLSEEMHGLYVALKGEQKCPNL